MRVCRPGSSESEEVIQFNGSGKPTVKEGTGMEENREKKKSLKIEQLFDILCLAASYAILFLLPGKVNAFFYLIFGAAAFLFCIGFFRLGFTIDAPADSKEERVIGAFYAVFGVLVNTAGLYGINLDNGSGRSIMIAVLLLIEALVLYAMAGGGAKTPEDRRMAAIVFRTAAVLLAVFGIAFSIWKHFSEASVIIAVTLVIESICLWNLGGGINPFNSMTDEIQTVPGLRIPIAQLQQDFAGVETQLGYPWIGKVKTIKQESIIYGPSEDGFFVHGYYQYGRFYVSGSTNAFFPDPEDAQGHAVTEIPDRNGVLLAKEELPKAYAEMFTRYAENGNAQWAVEYRDQTK